MQIRRQITTPFPKPTKPTKYLIIDTDVGGDDAQALIFAIHEAKRSNIEILGITCVNGNTYTEDVVRNVAIVLALCNVKIPIYSGAEQSLLANIDKDFYFSEDGLGSKQSKYWKQYEQSGRLNQKIIVPKQEKTAAQFIAQSARKYAGEISLIAIGPLTNLALAYTLDADIGSGKFNSVSIMGGSYTGLGIRHFFQAEFNFFLDCEAAQIVIRSFENVVLSVFDFVLEFDNQTTGKLFIDKSTEKGRFINDIYENILKNDPALLCDPITVLPICCPQLIAGYYEVEADVMLTGPRTRGTIVFEWMQKKEGTKESSQKNGKVKILTKVDLQAVTDRIMNSYK